MELVLIRHTACDVAAGVCYGHLDLPLCASADDDIAKTLLGTPVVNALFTSPARRCSILAQRLAARDACTLTYLDELRELNFGEWEGLRWDDIPRATSDAWASDTWNRSPPGGETEAQLHVRVERALRTIAAQRLPRVAIVAHAGPLRLLHCMLSDRPLADRWSWTIPLGGVQCIAWADLVERTVDR